MFNEGYSAHRGANLLRSDLCEEAIRLVQLYIWTERRLEPVCLKTLNHPENGKYGHP